MNVEIELHEAQISVIQRRKRFNHMRIGRRWGKSILGYALVLEVCTPDNPTAYCMPTAEDYTKRWMEFVQYYDPIIDKAYVSDGIVKLKNKGVVNFNGLHRFDGMRGNHYKRVVIDEAAHAQHLKQAWEYVIMPTLADLKGDAYIMSTPNGNNYFWELENNHKKDEDWAFFHLPSSGNPFLAASEIELQRKKLPSSVFMQEWLGDYIDLQGARVKREWLQFGNPPPLDQMQLAMGVDLAISTKASADYTACVVLGKHNNDIWVLDVQRTQQSFHGLTQFIASIYDEWKPDIVAIETVQFQQSVADVLISRGLPVRTITPTKDKVTRFLPLEGALEHRHVHIKQGVDSIFVDELLSFPLGAHDDMVDAFVYAYDQLVQPFFFATL